MYRIEFSGQNCSTSLVLLSLVIDDEKLLNNGDELDDMKVIFVLATLTFDRIVVTWEKSMKLIKANFDSILRRASHLSLLSPSSKIHQPMLPGDSHERFQF